MTRRELREHSFKVLFRADFYPVEEMDEQIERYFGAPVEDDVTPEGTTMQEVQRAASEQLERTIAALADKFPAPDKERSQLFWAAHMNGLKAQAEEVVGREIVYQ